MQRAKAAMGFRSVKRVEVKAETTTPGEVRTTTDANGVRVSASRARRTLPKLEFVVEENGAILHGPQRGLFPYYAAAAAATGSGGDMDAVEDTGRTGAMGLSGEDDEDERELMMAGAVPLAAAHAGAAPGGGAVVTAQQPMKDCVLNDSRATTLAVKYDPTRGKFVCGSSIERFSGHTGVCRVLGSKKYPIIPHSLQIGDLLRIGSVGLVVCELNRGPSDADVEALTEEEYQYIKENYLSLPLQQTFRPTDSTGRSNQQEDDDDDEEDDEVDGVNQHGLERARRQHKLRSGETSDEGESEEDGVKRSDDGNDEEEDEDDDEDHRRHHGSGKKAQRAKNRDALSSSKEKRFCYICYDTDEEPEENPLVAPCNCKGDTKYVHLECLQRWNNNLDADGSNPNHKMCAVTNTDGLDVCSICKGTYMTSVKLDDGRVVSLMAKKLPPPYVTFAVVTQHEARSRSTTLTNTRFQLSFASIPRGQQFLTIGRSTTNNMTLRYRTVSQLHAKVKFEDNNFYIYDASSSNGTMLFLSKPLELDWNKTVHVKIGRTILTLKSKKRWKWSGGGEFDDDALSSPRAAALESNQTQDEDQTTERLSSHRIDAISSPLVSDPSAELLSSPYAAALRQPLNRTFSMPQQNAAQQFSRTGLPSTNFELDDLRLSDLVTESDFIMSNHSGAAVGGYTSTPLRSSGATRAYPDLPASAIIGSNIPRITSRFMERQDRPLADMTERLSQMTMQSPSTANRLSAPGRFERS